MKLKIFFGGKLILFAAYLSVFILIMPVSILAAEPLGQQPSPTKAVSASKGSQATVATPSGSVPIDQTLSMPTPGVEEKAYKDDEGFEGKEKDTFNEKGEWVRQEIDAEIPKNVTVTITDPDTGLPAQCTGKLHYDISNPDTNPVHKGSFKNISMRVLGFDSFGDGYEQTESKFYETVEGKLILSAARHSWHQEAETSDGQKFSRSEHWDWLVENGARTSKVKTGYLSFSSFLHNAATENDHDFLSWDMTTRFYANVESNDLKDRNLDWYEERDTRYMKIIDNNTDTLINEEFSAEVITKKPDANGKIQETTIISEYRRTPELEYRSISIDDPLVSLSLERTVRYDRSGEVVEDQLTYKRRYKNSTATLTYIRTLNKRNNTVYASLNGRVVINQSASGNKGEEKKWRAIELKIIQDILTKYAASYVDFLDPTAVSNPISLP